MVKTLTDHVKKRWGIELSSTKTFGDKIYSLIGVGYKEYIRDDLDEKRTENIEVGEDKEGEKIYATYYFGDDY